MDMPYLNYYQTYMLVVIKSTSVSSITVANTETNDHDNAMVDHDKDVGIHLSFSPDSLINMQNIDTL